ncbi:MAG: class I SAM-dependent methyltransferase [Bacteriovoracia bacterium]
MTLTNTNQEPIDFEDVIHNGPFPIRFPKKNILRQDEEWCEVQVEGNWKKIRFHDYSDVYKVPGLYETIFYRTLRCNSPTRVSSLLNEALIENNISVDQLRVLDFGAGNGMAGEALQSLGIRKIVGVDLLEEAGNATLRDRPWVYDHYKVADFTKLSAEEIRFFEEYKFNVLCTVAALGFGDIPAQAFYTAFNFISDGGLVVFNIRDEFLKRSKQSPFAKLIDQMIIGEVIEIDLYKRYQHRLNIAGMPLYYVAIVARKLKDIPSDFLKS